jgi:hypothetical protein
MLCSGLYYFLRLYDPALSCKSLGNIIRGTFYNDQITTLFAANGAMERYPAYFSMIEPAAPYLGVPGKNIILASQPDLVDKTYRPTLMINVRSHDHDKKELTHIVASQQAFLRAVFGSDIPIPYIIKEANAPGLDTAIPDDFLKEYFGSYYPAYADDFIELYADDQLSRQAAPFTTGTAALKRNLKLLIVAKDGQYEINLTSEQLLPLREIFFTFLNRTVYAFLESEQHPHFNRDIFLNLVKHEMKDKGLLRSYQCKDCPAFGTGMCGGMPPLRKHRYGMDKSVPKFKPGVAGQQIIAGRDPPADIQAFVKFWRNEGMNIPDPPKMKEPEPYLNDQGGERGKGQSKSRSAFDETAIWTAEVSNEAALNIKPISIYPAIRIIGHDPTLIALYQDFL